MNIWTRLLVGLIGIPLGILILLYREKIVFTVGKMFWAEERFGSGSTYNIWIIIGLAVMFGSFLFMIDSLPFIG